MRPPIDQRAHAMIAAEIALALGCAHRSSGWWRCRCPVHRGRGPTLALRDGDRGLIAVCHAGCSRPDIFAELRRQGLIERQFSILPPSPMKRRANSDDDRTRRIESARRIWDWTNNANGSAVAAYLADAIAAVNRHRTLPPDRRPKLTPMGKAWTAALAAAELVGLRSRGERGQ
jgi:hypothetical protein